MKRFSTYNILVAGIGIVVITIALVLLISIRQSQRVRSTARSVDHTQEVLRHIQKVNTVALENETGARGYIITGQENFLGPVHNSEQGFNEELRILKDLVKDNDIQVVRLDSLEQVIAKRISFSEQMVQVRKEEGVAKAALLVERGLGRQYSDSIRVFLGRMEETEKQLLEQRRNRNDSNITRLNTILYVMLGAVFVLSAFIIRRVKADIDHQRQSERRFSSLLDAAPDATVIIGNDGRVKMINKQTEHLFGYSREQVIGQPVEALIPHSHLQQHILQKQNVEAAANRGAVTELDARKNSGELFPAEITLSPLQTEEGMLVIAAIRDITGRKKAEEQIKFLARLVENTSDAVFSTDPGFNIITWNKAAEKMYGFTAEEVAGKPVADILRPQMDYEVRMQIRKEMKEKGFWRGELVHLKKDGTPVPLLVSNTASYKANGEHEGYVNVGRDISERKKAEEAIRELNASLEKRVEEKTREIIASEKQLRHTLDNMLEGAQIIDFDYRYLYVNDSLTKHGKYSREEMIGYTVMEKYPGIEQTELFQVYERCFKERVSIHLENEFVFPDNTKGWFELSFQPVPQGIFILSVDITDRKKAQQQIQKLNEELEHKVEERTAELQLANKELESFTYSVSHDLRAPLRIIDGYSDILISEYQPVMDKEANRLLGIIKTNAQRMGQLIDDLLNLSQIGRKELVVHPTDMNILVGSVINEQLEFAPARPKIELHELEPAVCDSSLIRQVWINLVSNAIKYSSKNPAPEIWISSEKNNGEVIYTIRDNGVGFDMKYQEKLFGVFQRLHKATEFEGTGIGLALVNRILIKHKGRIWAHAERGKGATFSFSLPIIHSSTNQNGQYEAPRS